MKIIHICSSSAKPDGIKTVLKILSTKQREIGHDVKVFSLRNGEKNFECVNSVRKFTKKLDAGSPDIVIFHSVYYLLYVIYSIILTVKKIPYLIELHGALSVENYKVSHFKKVVANFMLFNSFLKHAKNIIYLNQNEYNNSIVKKINPNYTIIPNGCNPIVGLTPVKYDNAKIQIIYIGRIERNHKGLDILLLAIGLIPEYLKTKVHFIFYGDGAKSECDWFKEQISKISYIAEFKGPIDGKKKDEAMKNANIFILTSRFEGMPMGVLEALSYGLPCVLTPNTNLGYEVENAGAGWITSCDPSNIAKTIEDAVRSYQSTYNILSANALALSKKYNWNKIAENSIIEYSKSISQ